MTDLGLYNFIKNSLAQGKSKEEISSILAKGNWNQADIDEAFMSVASNISPVSINQSDPAPITVQSQKIERTIIISERPAIITALCGYFFVMWVQTYIGYFRYGNYIFDMLGSIFKPGVLNSQTITYLISGVAVFVGVIGYWFMKKWAVYLYTLGIVIYFYLTFSQINLRYFNSDYAFMIFLMVWLPVVMITVGFGYLKRMS